jgi:hypothetical protein
MSSCFAVIAPWLADEILCGICHVSEIGECALAYDDDFGVEREVHHLVIGDDLSTALTLRSLWFAAAKLMRRIES